jgi:hypothetical protein
MARKPKNPDDGGRPETGSGKGRRDEMGVMPDNIRVDPNIMEGHPGYQQSGESEIIPLKEDKKNGERGAYAAPLAVARLSDSYRSNTS